MGAPCPNSDLQRKHSKCDVMNMKNELQQLQLLIEEQEEQSKQMLQRETDMKKKSSSSIDGGWGWMVVIASAASFFVTGGFSRAFTLIYHELIIKFGQSASSTASVAVIFGAVKLCSSPLVALLCNKFSLRAVTITGGLISFVGMVMSSFPPSLPYLCFSYGIVTAFGANMVITPSFVIIGKYFRQKKAKAMSLVTIGACFGGMAFPPIIEVLLRRYGYTGAMLPSAVAMLVYCVSGLFYRPVENNSPSTGGLSGIDPKSADVIYRKDSKATENNNGLPLPCTVVNGLGSQIYAAQKAPITCAVVVCQGKTTSTEVLIDDSIGSASPLFGATKPRNFAQRLAIFTMRIPGVVSRAFGLHLLKNLRLAVFVILMASSFTSLGICNTFLSSLAAEVDVSRMQVAAMLAVSSAINIPCRFLTGVIFDLDCVRHHRDVLFGVVSMFTALFAILLPLSQNVYVMSALCVAHCFFGSSMHSQHMTVLSDLVESRQLASAMGLCRFFQGVGIIIGPIVGGVLRDQLGSYKYAFYGSGTLFLFTVIGYEIYTLVGVRMICRHREESQEKDATATVT